MGITQGVQKIQRPDWLQVHFDTGNNSKPSLMVGENGNTRSLPISKKVAEVLIATGASYEA